MEPQNKSVPLALAGRWVDQVLRLEQFRRAFPGVTFLSPRQTGKRDWVVTWDEEEGSVTHAHPELKAVLDMAEERFGRPE